MAFALFVLAGVYTVMLEPKLVDKLRSFIKFLSKAKGLYCGLDSRGFIKNRDEMLPRFKKKTLKAAARWTNKGDEPLVSSIHGHAE